MESTSRFEILNAIASGDFATVYRARDRELGREVAIKQIHPQYLTDPRQLDRYWREAHLLASLQHPNVLTVFDIVRARGWLILELLRGSLERTAQTAPLDLDVLRFVLLQSLDGLQFLHDNGIIHGDVKPSNLLVGAQWRIKLGDFGLARRASNEQGSLLKGTTKYMAPETISDQFGPVGPASDLYSLGFSAYELMCGPQFETLFPGLSAFGHGQHVAWLMWHGAPDRRLPEIHRVLEGVPDDLARSIERLTAKNAADRYATAEEALQDLRRGEATSVPVGHLPADPSPPPERGKKRRRVAVLSAVASSVILAVAMLPSRPVPVDSQAPQVVAGMVRMVDRDRRIVVLEGPDGNPMEIQDLRPDDRFFVNDKKALLGELLPRDRVTIQYVRGEDGRRIAEIYATRPQVAEGTIKAVDPAAGSIVIATGTGGQELPVRVPGTVTIVFNGQERLDGRPPELADLRSGDRIVVRHVAEPAGRAAVALSVSRLVELAGVVRGVDLQQQSLTLETGEGPQAAMRQLVLAPQCRVRLNNSDTLDDRVLSAADIQPGDRATITQDVRVVSIDATRVVTASGVVQSVQSPMLAVQVEGQTGARNFLVGPECKVTLTAEPAELGELRPGDLVEVSHDAPSARTPNPRAMAIVARRPENRSRWAIVIGVQNYDDASLGSASSALADAQVVRDALVKRHAVPNDQALALSDPSLVRLKQGVASLLERVQAADQLVVYYAGRATRDADGKIYVAPKEFRREQPAATGLSLQELIDQLEACPAKEKVFLWDARGGPGNDPPDASSSAEMLQTLGLPMRTVTSIASCSEGQQGQLRSDGKVGLFAASVADGFSGRADKNRDSRLESTELVAFLNAAMVAARPAKPQTAKLFLPDDKPPRLSKDAKDAIRALAVTASQGDVNLGKLRAEFKTAQELAGGQPEPGLLLALALLRASQWSDAQRQFDALRVERPEMVLPLEGLVWVRFKRRDYARGVQGLVELMGKAKRPQASAGAVSADFRPFLTWAGRLREFVAGAEESGTVPENVLQQLDAAVAVHGPAAVALYQEGRDAAKAVLQEYDRRIASAADAATKIKSEGERRTIRYYAEFPFEAAVHSVLGQLD